MNAHATAEPRARSPAADRRDLSAGGRSAEAVNAGAPATPAQDGAPRRELPRWRRALPFVLLFSVSAWATLEWLAQNEAFAWTAPPRVRVVPLIAPEVDASSGEIVIATFLDLERESGAGLGAVRAWLEEEFRGFTGRDGPVMSVDVSGPVHSERPAPAFRTTDPGLFARMIERRRLVRYFQEATTARSGDADVVVYVYFYAPRDRGRYSGRSAACHATREGFVFVPVDTATLGYYQALFAHELCHAFGARDKYDEDGSSYPRGYAEPMRLPLYPQTHAEIMALAIPTGKGKEAYVEGVRDCVIGVWTAREMGWGSARE